MRAQLRLGTDRLCHTDRSMPVKQSALAELEIEVVVTVDVPEMRTATAREVEWDRRLHFSDTAVYASGDATLGSGKKRLRLSEGVGHKKSVRE